MDSNKLLWQGFVLFILLIPYTLASPLAPDNPLPPLPVLECYPSHLPPLLIDCQYLNAFIELAVLKENRNRRYARNLPDTPTTRHLPKNYFVHRFTPRFKPSTCMLSIDENPRPGFPDWDEFTFKSLGIVSQNITDNCLIPRKEVGFDFPGKLLTVKATLTRYVGPTSLDEVTQLSSSGSGMTSWNLTMGNETAILYEVDAPIMSQPFAILNASTY